MSFKRNVSTLLVGAFASQAIVLIAQPLFTRIFTQEQFGIYAIFSMGASFLLPLVTLRSEHLVYIKDSSEEIALIASASIFIAATNTLLIGLLFFLLPRSILENENVSVIHNTLPWFLIFQFSIACIEIGTSVAGIKSRFWTITWSRMIQSLVMVSSAVFLGWFMKYDNALTIAATVGALVAASFFGSSLREGRQLGPLYFRNVAASTAQVLLKFKYLLTIQTTSTMLNLSTNRLPLFFIAAVFGLKAAGLFGLTLRVMSTPIQLISRSFLDAFKQQAYQSIKDTGKCDGLFLRLMLGLSSIGFPPAIVGAIWAPEIFAFVFGNEWREAGQYAQVMIPMFFLRLSASPLSYVLIITENQIIETLWQIALLLGVLLLFYTAANSSPIVLTLKIYSCFYTFMYFIYLVISYLAASGRLYKNKINLASKPL